MAFIADRVKENTSTAGTGALTLSGAATGSQTFAAAFAVGSLVPYCIVNGNNWEVGVGTLTTATTLARTTVEASSSGAGLITLSGGMSQVFVSLTGRSTHRLSIKTAEVSAGLVEAEKMLEMEYAPAGAPSQTIKFGDISRFTYTSASSNSGVGHSGASLAWYRQNGAGNPNYAIGHESKWEGLSGSPVLLAAAYDAQLTGNCQHTNWWGVNSRILSFTGTINSAFGFSAGCVDNTGAITNYYGFFHDVVNGAVTNKFALYNNDPASRIYSKGPVCDGSFQYEIPLTGATITMGALISTLLINPAGTLASLTVNLPAAKDGQRATICSNKVITAFTLAAVGTTLLNPITTLTAGGSAVYQYFESSTLWFKVG